MVEVIAKLAAMIGGYNLVESLVKREKYVYSCPTCNGDIEANDKKCHVCNTELEWGTDEE